MVKKHTNTHRILFLSLIVLLCLGIALLIFGAVMNARRFAPPMGGRLTAQM